MLIEIVKKAVPHNLCTQAVPRLYLTVASALPHNRLTIASTVQSSNNYLFIYTIRLDTNSMLNHPNGSKQNDEFS